MKHFFVWKNIAIYSRTIKLFLSCSILGLCILFLIDNVSSSEAQKIKDVEIIINQVNNGTYLLVGKGGNIGLSVGDEGVLLIDSQFEQLTDKILLI